MIAVSASIKNAYNNYTTQRKPYIIVGNNTYYIQNMDLQADCYDEGNIIGNAIAKILKFDIETEYVEGLDEFELYDSIWTGNQYESVFLGTFKLYDEEGTDDYFSSVTAYDLLIKFNAQYDPSQMTYPSTVFGLLQNICNQAGVTLENTSIVNGTQQLETELFVEGETLKTILNAICQVSGTFGMISNDKLRLGLKGTQTISLQKYQISEPEFKRTTQNINQVVLGMTDIEGEEVKYPQDSQISGTIHKLTINNNPFVYNQTLREAYIQNIYNQVNGFGYEAMSMKWEGLSYVELGDLLSVDGHSSMVLRYNIKSPNGLESTLEAPSIIDSSVEYYENSNSIENRQKRTEYIVDKANQRITQIVEEIGDRSEKSTSITQDIDSIVQQVSQIETLTSDLTQNSSLTIEDAFEGEIVKFSISGNMSLLYPSDDLYPSNDLYPLDSYLIIQYEDETQDKIHLPLNYLRYLNATTYDEFIVESGQAKIIRRVGENEDGSFYALTSEIEEDKGNLIIALKEGYNKLWLESFYNLSLKYSAKYVIKSDYTDVFATKVEMHSEISQTASEINLEVSKKVDENEVIAAINLTSEAATIDASKINLNGYVTVTDLAGTGTTTINGSNIKTGTIDASLVSVVNLNANNITSGTLSADKINGGTISASSINLGNNKFAVDTNGNLTATSGYIGGWTIASNLLKCEVDNYEVTIMPGTNSNKDFLIVHNTSDNTYPFYVRTNGYLSATNANIQGTISSSSINGSTISGGSISISRGKYYFNMGLSTNNPNCSGLNVGTEGIKAQSGVAATGFSIYESDTGKDYNLQIRDYHGNVHHLTFRGGIITKWEYT